MKKYYIWKSSPKVLDYYLDDDEVMIKCIKYFPYECLGYVEGAKEICSFFLSRNGCPSSSPINIKSDFELPNDGESFETKEFIITDLYVVQDQNGNIRNVNEFICIPNGRSPRKRKCSKSKCWKDQTKRRFQWRERK